MGKAIKYCRNQWDKLEGFMLDGRLELSNNRSERSIKPFVIGENLGYSVILQEVQHLVQLFIVLLKLQKKMVKSIFISYIFT